ncbi:hypothetical protein [Dictyobacter formicarum]|uniref:hypothetical protein n=1 Tax=Dictyobacter formicarum TaxID=2778368 RepID=UPI00191523CB|nr:hypothetical protein [Dictyobacter formicarum]
MVTIDRLLTVERTADQERERWLAQQDEVLTWRLRAGAAEVRLSRDRDDFDRSNTAER